MANSQKETWKPIPGWEQSHEVSDQGRVRRFAQRMTDTKGVTRNYPERILKGRIDSTGYHRVKLCFHNRKQEAKTHQLVALAFLGPRPHQAQVCHGDGDQTNNALVNLRYGTAADNAADTAKHGSLKGRKNGRAKLNEHQVRLVRQIPNGFVSALARAWGVSSSCLFEARNKTHWSHV